MKKHLLLLFCLIFIAATALAEDTPLVATDTVDANANIFILDWQVPAYDSYWMEEFDAGMPGTWTFERAIATPSWIQSDEEVTDLDLVPAEFELKQAYPNPFNPTTTVSVILPETAELNVTVFNVAGQQVAELTSGKLVAGTHSFVFDASHLASGLYFVQAQVPGKLNEIQKITLMK